MKLVLLLTATVISTLVVKGGAQCTTSTYDIVTTGVTDGVLNGDRELTVGPPDEFAAYQGVPLLPNVESSKKFCLQTDKDARMYLAPGPRIPAASTDYIRIDFTSTTLDFYLGTGMTDTGLGVTLSASACLDLTVDVDVANDAITITDMAGNIQRSYTFTAGLPDIKFILVQTPTAADADTATWKFCDEGLQRLSVGGTVENSAGLAGSSTAVIDDNPNMGVRDITTCSIIGPDADGETWLRVDLGDIYDIKAVTIFPAIKFGSPSTPEAVPLTGATVRVGTCDHAKGTDIDKNTQCGTSVAATDVDERTDTFWMLKECSPSLRGSFMYILDSMGGVWSICEVQVWGIPVTGPTAMLSFSEVASSELESVTSRTITVMREGDMSSCAYYNIEFVAGTATDLVLPKGSPTAADDLSYVVDDIVPKDTPDQIDIHKFEDVNTPQEFTVTVIDDMTLEDDETFGFTLENVTGATTGTNPSTTLTIQDNDFCYTWKEAAYSFKEDVGAATPILTKVGYDGSDTKACVNTTLTGVAGAADITDFTARATTSEVTFLATSPEENVEVQITDDNCMLNADDSNDFEESFFVTLEAGVACSGDPVTLCDGGIAETEVAIENDDDVMYKFQTTTVEAVNEDVGTTTIVVERVGSDVAQSPPIDVKSQPNGASAVEGTDYTQVDTPVTIPQGQTTTSFDIIITDDMLVESRTPEEFTVLLGANLDECEVDQAAKSKMVTITDNDCYYSFNDDNADGDSVVNVEVNEGAGTTQLTVNCARDDDLQLLHSGYVDINVAQVTGKTAISGEDFDVSGTNPVRVFFTPGSYTTADDGTSGKDTASLSIDINNDNIVEETTDEVFSATLADSNGEIRGVNQADITIADNDAVISLRETYRNVSESETEVTVILDRSGDLSGSDSVRLISRGVTAYSGSSADNGDYKNVYDVFSFTPGEPTAAFILTLFDDDVIEVDETFIVSIEPLTTEDLTIDPAKKELTVTIRDNECLFTLEVDNVVVSENNDGGVQPTVTATVHRNGFRDQVSSITLETSNAGTPVRNRDDASADEDYVSLSEELVFRSGDVTRQATIAILNDDRPEISEVFMLSLSNAQCDVDGASRKLITIQDDDEIVIKMSQSQQRVYENAGEVVINLERTGSQADEDTVRLSVKAASVGGSKSATPNSDYGEATTYTATFLPNRGDTSISIPIFDDKIQEDAETFVVQIVGIENSDSLAKISSNAEETKTIIYVDDDDDAYTMEKDYVSLSESTGSYTLNVERTGARVTTGTVYVYTRDETASSPGDYKPISSRELTFAPGTPLQPVTVQIENDNIEEGVESFVLILSSEDGNSIDTTTIDIQDNDFPISFKDENGIVYVEEGDTSVLLTVQRTRSDFGRPGQPASVRVMTREVISNSVTNNAAKSGEDFDSVNEELQFSSFGTEVEFTVNIRDDDVAEGEEKFEVYLSDPSPSTSHYITYPNVLTIYIRDSAGGSPGGPPGVTGDPGTGTGTSLSQVSIILIGGGIGLLVLLLILGIVGLVLFKAVGSGSATAASAAATAAAPPPAYRSASYYPDRRQPVEFGRQQPRGDPRRSYYNQGY